MLWTIQLPSMSRFWQWMESYWVFHLLLGLNTIKNNSRFQIINGWHDASECKRSLPFNELWYVDVQLQWGFIIWKWSHNWILWIQCFHRYGGSGNFRYAWWLLRKQIINTQRGDGPITTTHQGKEIHCKLSDLWPGDHEIVTKKMATYLVKPSDFLRWKRKKELMWPLIYIWECHAPQSITDFLT